jgi:hypothetical protein
MSMLEPLITVIVPIYKAQAYLPGCIDSIIGQSYTNFELLLIDDGSPDDCPGLCEAYAQKDERVRVLHIPNGGVANARNVGLDHAQGRFICFVDADDSVRTDYLAYLWALLRDRAGCKLSACNHWIVSEDGVRRMDFPESDDVSILTSEQAFHSILYHGILNISPWGKLYDREVFEGLRYPKGMLFEDTYLIADVLKRSGGVVFGARPKYGYRYHTESISKGTFDSRMWDLNRAVDHLTEVVLAEEPGMVRGCLRRKVHAALSTRRFLVDCAVADRPQREALEAIVRRNAWTVLTDGCAPVRDKAAVLSILLGPRFYDAFWKRYIRRRWRSSKTWTQNTKTLNQRENEKDIV